MKKELFVLFVLLFAFSFVGAYVYDYNERGDFSLRGEDDLKMEYAVAVDEDFNLSDIEGEGESEEEPGFSAMYVRPNDKYLVDAVWKADGDRVVLLLGIMNSNVELNGIYFLDANNDDKVVGYHSLRVGSERERTVPSPWFMPISVSKSWFKEVDGQVAVKVIFDIHLRPNNEEGPVYVDVNGSEMPKIENWYCGDTHYHSWYTNTEWALGTFGELGAPISFASSVVKNIMDFDWFTVTDHSNSFEEHKDDSWDWSAFVEECGRYENCLIGEEINCRTSESGSVLGNSLPGNHFLAYDIDDVFLDDGQNDVPYCDEIVDRVYEQGGFGYVAHPESDMDFVVADIVMPWEDYSLGFSGLEVWNGDINDLGDSAFDGNSVPDGEERVADLEAGIEGWKDVLLGREGLDARKVYVSAGSDAHGDFQSFGKEYTCCYAENYSKENIFGALEDGNCYMGNDGVFVFWIDNLHGDVVMMGEEINVLENGNFRFNVTAYVDEECKIYFIEGIVGEEDEYRERVDRASSSDSPMSGDFDMLELEKLYPNFDTSVDSRRYYRFDCLNENESKRIYTNPIWVNPIECFEDSDCGESYLESSCDEDRYCESGMNYFCRNAGEDDAYCEEKVVDSCEECRFGCSEESVCEEGKLCHVKSPSSGDVFDDNSVPFEIFGSENLDSIEYIDYSDRFSRWRSLCRNCEEYVGDRGFSEGEYDVVVRCSGSFVEEYDVDFFVDSREPVIFDFGSDGEFSNGSFNIRFREENPSGVFLHYGDSIAEVNLRNCSEKWGGLNCDVSVDLPEGEIEYWFVVEDVAGNRVESEKKSVFVDTIPPVVNNPDSFWTEKSGWFSNYIYFNISITEENFKEVFLNYNSWGRTRKRVLCSELDDGFCEERFWAWGSYDNLRVVVEDEAGNRVEIEL